MSHLSALDRHAARQLGQAPLGLGPRLAPSLAVGCVGAASAMGADLLPSPGPAYAAAAGITLASLVHGLRSARAHPRDQLTATVAGALLPLIGRDGRVSASRWRDGWVGTPERVRIDYDPQAGIEAADWTTRLTKVVSTRMGAPYRLVRHDVRRARLRFERLPVAEAPPSPALAKRVESIISTIFGAEAKVQITWDQDQVVALDVSHQIGVRVSASSALRHKIAETISVMLAGRWRARWDLEADTVRIELRPEIPATLAKDLSAPVGAELNRLPYMVDEDGVVLTWDLSSGAGTPHMLVIGPTGSGKTVLIRGLVTEACRRMWRVRICDPKRIEFVGLRVWPNVEIVATVITDIVAVIHDTYVEMMHRYELIEHGKAFAGDFDRVVLVLDEYRYFYGVVNAWYQGVKGAGGSRACPILEEVFLIASLGRAAGVHIVLGTQRPDADWLGGDVRDQFQCRASLGRLSPDGAKMLWGDYVTGVSVPRRKPGRGISVNLDGDPVEAQAYWTPDPARPGPEEGFLLEQLRPSEVRWPGLVVEPVRQVDDDGNPLPDKGRYSEYRDAHLLAAASRPDLLVRADLIDPLATYLQDADDGGPSTSTSTDRDELYDASRPGPAHHVRSGDLVCLDESVGLWAVVETAEEDLVDADQVAICWRSDEQGEEYGVLVLDSNSTIQRRPPLSLRERPKAGPVDGVLTTDDFRNDDDNPMTPLDTQ